MAVIDLEKIQKTMDFLADKQEGRNSLLAFRVAIENLRKSIPTKDSDAEFLYVLQRLVGQMRPHDLSPGAKAADGSLSDRDLDAVVGGISSLAFNATGVQVLGDFRSIGNLGFRILANVV